MGFYNFRLNTSPNIRNVFHVDKLRAVSTDYLFSWTPNDNYPGPTIIGNEYRTHEYDVEFFLKKSGRGYQYLVKWKNYVRFIWEPQSFWMNLKPIWIEGWVDLVVGLAIGSTSVSLLIR